MFLAIPLYDDTPRLRLPVATIALIAVCALVFLWQLGLDDAASVDVSYSLGMVPSVLFGSHRLSPELRIVPAWATIFTSMFMHGGWLHILGNMLYLWIFGRGVESALGAPRYLLLYFAGGVVAAFTQAGVDPSSSVPMIGASGAIAGVLGAYLLLYPRSNVVVFFWIIIIVRLISVPAVILLGLWFLMQVISAASASPGEPGVAVWAHVGGFLAGMVLVLVLRHPSTTMFQPSRSASFMTAHPREARSGFGRGSVPSAGQRREDRGPWG